MIGAKTIGVAGAARIAASTILGGCRNDDIDTLPGQILECGRQPLWLAVHVLEVEDDRATFDVSELAQSIAKRLEDGLVVAGHDRAEALEHDPGHSL
jgi:hypothetical protein